MEKSGEGQKESKEMRPVILWLLMYRPGRDDKHVRIFVREVRPDFFRYKGHERMQELQ